VNNLTNEAPGARGKAPGALTLQKLKVHKSKAEIGKAESRNQPSQKAETLKR
jgi:hypothetical protein